ncbi:MAG: OB-fold domain-containing protein [Pseudomonas sp.]|uniref:Zn-ribbon domain-containing OB-fold protein n=1 Tax=Pseudomonas sp. TaxID=306 RepID=UPI0039825965
MSVSFASLPRRHLPALTPENAFFWTSGEHGELRFIRCTECGFHVHPPLPICPHCQSRDVHPETVSGRATVVSFTINRQVWEPGLEDPYVVALVEIEEQPSVRLTTNIVNCPVDAVHIGMQVRVLFDHREDVWLPLFEPLCAAPTTPLSPTDVEKP